MNRIPAVRRAILADVGPLTGLLLTAAAVAIPTLARWLIDRGEAGIPFVTYFPFILLSALLLGWRYGTLTAVLSGLIANRLLREEPVLFYVGWIDAAVVGMFFVTCAILIYMGDLLRRLVRELEEAKAREQLLSGELLHRARNTLAIVGALAGLTARRTKGEDFFPAFSDRIDALSRATVLLGGDQRELRDVRNLIEHAIAPFRSGDNFRLDGPACEIPDASCMPLMLVLHELCTNAAKYGALTAPEGTVEIAWSLAQADGPLRLSWVERGGPTVSQPGAPGMGSTLLRAQKGLRSVELTLPPDGAECAIEIDGGRAL